MDQVADTETHSKFIDMDKAVLIRVALLGVILGAVAWLLTLLFSKFVLDPIFCGNEATTGTCLNSNVIAGNTALILTAVAGVLGLVRLGVYRPMLVAIAVVIALWGISGWVDGLAWYEGFMWTIALYAASFVTFSWLVRPRVFLVAIILVLVMLALARILPIL